MVRKKSFLFACLILAVLVLSTSGVVAQRQTPTPLPDSDGDGVPDKDDHCPGHSGPAANNGCPPDSDSDGDGLPDSMDVCPNESGSQDNAGCPLPADSDGDGIADDQDRCPTVAGLPGTNGCPLPVIPDSGRCAIATAGEVPVNVRNLPSTQYGAIIGSLFPLNVYPVNLQMVTEEGSWYHVIGEGWVAGWVMRVGGDCALLPAIQTYSGQLTVGPFTFDFSIPNTPPPLITFDESGAPMVECDEDQHTVFGCQGKPHVLGERGSLVYFGDDNGVGEIGMLSNKYPEIQAIIGDFVPPPDSGFPADSFFDVFFDITVDGDPLADDGEHGDGAAPFFVLMPPDPLEDDGEHGDLVAEFFAFLIGEAVADDGAHGDGTSTKMGIVIIELPGGGEGILLIDGTSPGDDTSAKMGIVIIEFPGVDGESFVGLMLLNEAAFDGVDGESLTGETQGSIFVLPGSEFMFNPQPEPPAVASIALFVPGADVMFNPQPEPPGLFVVGWSWGESTIGYEGVDGESLTGETQGLLFIGGMSAENGALQGLNVNFCQGGASCNSADVSWSW